MAPPVKKCRGCGTAVVNPVTCARCDIVAHPGCLKRTGHPSHDGLFLNCGPCLSGTADVDVNVISSQSVMPFFYAFRISTLFLVLYIFRQPPIRIFLRNMLAVFRRFFKTLVMMFSAFLEIIISLMQSGLLVWV